MRSYFAALAVLAAGCGHLEGIASPIEDADGGVEGGTPPTSPGGQPPPPVGAGCASCKIVFVTSAAVAGNAVSDTLCNTLANASSDARVVGHSFHAWRSVSSGSASMSVSRAGAPYVRLDGTPIAANWAQLTSGILSAPIDEDERGMQQRSDSVQAVWTGTDPMGNLVVDTGMPMNCSDWGSAASSGLGIVGRWAIEDGEWTNMSLQGCDMPGHVYCLEN